MISIAAVYVPFHHQQDGIDELVLELQPQDKLLVDEQMINLEREFPHLLLHWTGAYMSMWYDFPLLLLDYLMAELLQNWDDGGGDGTCTARHGGSQEPCHAQQLMHKAVERGWRDGCSGATA